MDKNLQSKKDREAMIEAYDQEGDRNSHKLGKQAAKYAGVTSAAVGVPGVAIAMKAKERKSGRGAAEFLKGVGANNKTVKAALKHPKLAKAALVTAGAGGVGVLSSSGAYGGTRIGRAIGKKIENVSESASHSSQKNADENKVAAGKMSREEFAQKYGKDIKPSQKREFKKKD